MPLLTSCPQLANALSSEIKGFAFVLLRGHILFKTFLFPNEWRRICGWSGEYSGCLEKNSTPARESGLFSLRVPIDPKEGFSPSSNIPALY